MTKRHSKKYNKRNSRKNKSKRFGQNYQQDVNALTGAMGPKVEANWPFIKDLQNTWSMSSHPLYLLGDRYIPSFEQNADKMSVSTFNTFGRKKKGCGCGFGRRGSKKMMFRGPKRSFGKRRFGCGCGPKITM